MAGNSKCHRYKEIRPKDQSNCINCHNWRVTRCELHEQLSDDHKDTEALMRHDAYSRGHSSIRQTRRG
ncbi:MAG TPA: hypothetical protein VFC84_02025 [Desulfosporosinus sp.]|nr:hypothetical protein [Desulfosporosinus sp.]